MLHESLEDAVLDELGDHPACRRESVSLAAPPLQISTQPLSPPAPWQGGKCRLAERLVARIQAIPHDIYAEAFVGMGGVFFRRRARPRVEAVNDLSRDIANFFRVLQRHADALIGEMLKWRLACRDEFDRQLRADPDLLTDLERAARFYYLQRLAYAGKVTGRTFAVSSDRDSRFNMLRLRLHLERLHARMAGVFIECLPFDDFIPRYDRVDALFYIDPPYFRCEDDYGKGMFARSDFETLADILAALKGRFLLSLNDTPEVRDIFAAFHIEEVETRYTIGQADRNAAAREVIISDGPRDGDGMVKQENLL